MNDESSLPIDYIEIPYRIHAHTERIDAILERRMREFMLSRRRKIWQAEGR